MGWPGRGAVGRARARQTIANLPVYYVSIVEKSNSANDLGSVEATSRLVELALVLHVKHEIAACTILHSKEQVALGEDGDVSSALWPGTHATFP